MKRVFSLLWLLIPAFALAQDKVVHDIYHQMFLGVPTWQWIGLAGSLAVGAILSPLGWWLVTLVLRIRGKLSRRKYPGQIRRTAQKAGAFFMFALVTGLVEGQLGLTGAPARGARICIDVLTIIGAALLLIAFWDVVATEMTIRITGKSDNRERILLPVIRNLVKGAIVAVAALFIVAEVSQVNVAAFIASLGIGGVVLALAAKDSVENIFGSITMLFDEPFSIGDWIKVNDTEGIVEEINIRSTKIRTFSDTLVTMPNSTWITASVENWSKRRRRRTRWTFKLSYQNESEKIEAFRSKLLEDVQKVSNIIPEKTVVEVSSLDQFAVAVYVEIWIETGSDVSEYQVRREVLLEALHIGEQIGIQFLSIPTVVPENPTA